MSGTVVRFPDPPSARDTAGLWIARIDRGLTAEEARELERWLAADRANAVAFAALAELWEQTGRPGELAKLLPAETLGPQPRSATRPVAAAAAVAAVAIVGALAWTLRPASEATSPSVQIAPQTYEYQTVVGAQSTVHLPDGSAVTLNTASEIEVRYSAGERAVLLEEGEAFFDVMHDAARPFRVYAGGRAMQAIGTAFDVRLDAGNHVRLMVTQGVVGVIAVAGEPGTAAAAVIETTVEAGKLARLDVGPATVENLGIDAVQTRLSWQRGMLAFEDEPLEAVLAEMGRYTTIELVPDVAVRDVRVGGYFRATDVDGLLFALEENFGIRSTRAPDGRILLTAK